MPIQKLVIVSDAHLAAAPPPVEEALLGFLDQLPGLGDGLLLNGDLFAFWFTYRRAIPRAGVRVLARLAALARKLPVLMTGGNHDRWGDAFWEREFGIRFAAGELRFRVGNRAVLALHGDGVAEPSWATAFKQRVIGHPLVSLGYRALPAELGFRLASRLERLEQSEAQQRREAKAAELQREWAMRKLGEEPALGLLVMGHTHRAIAVEAFPGRWYLNPGAWFDGNRYATATESEVRLERFPG